MLLNSLGRISYTKRLGLQWEAHVAPHSTCASRCSLGKVDSLPWASSRGQEILVFCYGCGIGGSNLLRKSYWDCSGKHMSPRIRHVLPAAVWGRLIRCHGHHLGVRRSLFFVMDVVLEGQICYAKAIGTAVGSTCRPAFDMCFPLQFGEG